MSNRSLRKNNRGVSALEYALIAAVIAGVGAAGASFMGVETDRLLDRVAVVVSGGGEEELEPDTPSTFSGSIVPTTFQWSTNVSTSEMLTVSGGTGPYTLAVISGARNCSRGWHFWLDLGGVA